MPLTQVTTVATRSAKIAKIMIPQAIPDCAEELRARSPLENTTPKLRFPREAGGVTRAGISNLRFDSRVEICAQDLWHRSCATDPARGERGARAKRTWPERIGCLPRKSARPGGAACLRGSRGPRSLAGRGA